MTDLSGTWLGSYWQNGDQIRFEFALIHGGNLISGNILDDCYLGEANITGNRRKAPGFKHGDISRVS
ncbi:MAG: hypothetical protein HC852_02025 [Acaryochloridaceae cyanobacterium RU_4_10]|nr:hypothetical protein [Acaryochloridaceae cyanobacterium RU_4_10]